MSKQKAKKRVVSGYGILCLAAKNVRINLWINLKLVFVFACLAFVLSLFTGYNGALRERREDIVSGIISGQYAYISSTLGSSWGEKQNASAELYFPGREGYAFRRLSLMTRVNRAQKINISTCLARHLVFTADGEIKPPADDTERISCYSAGFPFLENDYLELQTRFGLTELLYGRRPETPEEIVISENFLLNHGLTRDAVGSQVTVRIDGEKEDFFQGTVVGVIAKEYYLLTGHNGWSQQCLPILMLSEDNPVFRTNSFETHIFPVFELPTEAEIKEMATNSVFFAAAEAISTVDTLDKVTVLANTLYVVIGSALIIGLILTVMLMIGKYIKIFSRASGMYMTFGLERSRLAALLLCQLFILALITIPFAALITGLGYLVIGRVMFLVTSVMMDTSLSSLATVFLLGSAAVLVVELCFFLLAIFRLRGKTIRELLTTEIN